MAIEFASLADEPWIRQLLTICGLPQEDLTKEHLPHFLVYKEKGQLWGVIGLEIYGRVALLRSLAVAPAYRHRKLATQLTTRAEDYAASLGVKEIYLLTNSAANFFSKKGYQIIDRVNAPLEIQNTREFRDLCPVSSIFMHKHLGGSP